MASDFFVLDLGESLIKVADVHVSGGKFVAESLGMVETNNLFYKSDTPDALQKQGEIIAKLLTELKIKKKSVHIILPDAFTFSRFVEMPNLNEKELLSAIKYQADQFIPMPIEDTNIDIEVVHQDTKNAKLLTLISAAPKKLIQRMEDMSEYIGLIPETIETEISAVARLSAQIFKKTPSTQQKPGILLVNMSQNSTSVYCFDQNNGILMYNHVFNIGLSLFAKEVQVNLNIEPNKAMELLQSIGLSKNASYSLDVVLAAATKDFLNEIQKTISVIANTYGLTLSGIYMFQDAQKFFELDKIVGRAFGVPTSYLDLYPYLEQNNITDFFKTQLSYFVPAVGGNLT